MNFYKKKTIYQNLIIYFKYLYLLKKKRVGIIEILLLIFYCITFIFNIIIL